MKSNTYALLIALFFCTSCASIVSKSKYPLFLTSTPDNGTVSITNKKGDEVFRGATPATAELKSGAGFFSGEHYKVTFQKDSFDPVVFDLKCKVDGWYWGNLLFGGVLGFLIIDPATGAMYKLPETAFHAKFSNTTSGLDSASFAIYSIDEIPESWKVNLIKIQ
jgi:hypothetical protein